MSANPAGGAVGLTRSGAKVLRICSIETFEVDNTFVANYPDKAGGQFSLRMSQGYHEHCPNNRQAWG
ncbi:hypothetical protein NITHO_5680002 [Nitrolancea hollandica Lb]|uniref:Uncharacterized protein n=1 Tax=Nitrolancea hollandica Lb TaxID=1129897 RepID=I4EM61_9BACT|nr:hypothetical protein NITHO_5680002 [Nitrolancea hollandica Lb]